MLLWWDESCFLIAAARETILERRKKRGGEDFTLNRLLMCKLQTAVELHAIAAVGSFETVLVCFKHQRCKAATRNTKRY